MSYIDVRKIEDMYPTCTRIDIYGRRKSGKSFSVKCSLLDHYLLTGHKAVYVGRLEKHIKGSLIGDFFQDVLQKAPENYREQLNNKFNIKHADILYFRSAFWVVDVDVEHKKNIYLDTIMICTAVKDAETFKRRTFTGDFDRLVFDEVISATGDYIRNENDLLQKILDTMDRNNTGTIRSYLLGNPDYDIEQNIYLQGFKLNYAAMPLNSVLTFDTKDEASGKVYKNNIIICKVASPVDESEEFTKSSGVFSAIETRSAISGEVKHGSYNTIILKDFIEEYEFVPLLTIEQQTAVYIESGRYRNIYATMGFGAGRVPTIIIHRHDFFKKANHIYSTYFLDKIKPTTYLYKANMSAYPKVKKYFDTALQLNNVFVEDESTAQTFFNIMKEGRLLPY